MKKSNFKIGCDIVRISRIKDLLQDEKSLKKVFHATELTRLEAEHLAGVFAAKEAVIKALGYQPESWLKIEVRYEDNGRPKLELYGEFAEQEYAKECTISHDGDYATAFVIFYMTSNK